MRPPTANSRALRQVEATTLAAASRAIRRAAVVVATARPAAMASTVAELEAA